MSANIVGVKYVGSKAIKQDNVLNSGVEWTQGQVINFNLDAANKLAAYVGVWEIVDVDHNAITKVVGDVKPSQNKHAPATFADVNSMDKEALYAFARTTLLRQLPDMPEAELREAVKAEVTKSFLDEEIERLDIRLDSKLIALEVTDAEYEAYKHGIVELRLVSVDTPKLPLVAEEKTAKEGDLVTEQQITENSGEQNVQGDENTPTETLPELLARLDTKELRVLAKQSKVSISNTMNADQLRKKILAEVGDKGSE